MTVHRGRDLEATRERFSEWVAKELGDPSASVSALTPPSATGFSNETLFFDLSRTGRATESLVLRIQPTDNQVFPDYDLPKQIRCMRLLAETDIPVPRVIWFCQDANVLGAPFYVMPHIEGRIPTDNPPYHAGGWLQDAPIEERRSIWWSGLEQMAKIHRLDWRAAGFDFLDRAAATTSPLALQLDQYRRYLEWAARGKPQPTCEAALEWLEENQPTDEPRVLNWGDARMGNMIFRDGICVAVLDWEMVTVGSPEADLAWWLFLDRHHCDGIHVPRLDGFPSREETLARYTEWTGHEIRHLDYYEAFAAFRFSVIMIRLAQQFQAFGLLPEDSDFETNNIPSRMLAEMLELPPPDAVV